MDCSSLPRIVLTHLSTHFSCVNSPCSTAFFIYNCNKATMKAGSAKSTSPHNANMHFQCALKIESMRVYSIKCAGEWIGKQAKLTKVQSTIPPDKFLKSNIPHWSCKKYLKRVWVSRLLLWSCSTDVMQNPLWTRGRYNARRFLMLQPPAIKEKAISGLDCVEWIETKPQCWAPVGVPRTQHP